MTEEETEDKHPFEKDESVWRNRVIDALRASGHEDAQMASPSEQAVGHDHLSLLSFSDHSVCVSWSIDWATNVGVVMSRALRTNTKAVCLLLYFSDNSLRRTENARLIARNNTPPLQVWTLDARNNLLDTGNGRIITVG